MVTLYSGTPLCQTEHHAPSDARKAALTTAPGPINPSRNCSPSRRLGVFPRRNHASNSPSGLKAHSTGNLREGRLSRYVGDSSPQPSGTLPQAQSLRESECRNSPPAPFVYSCGIRGRPEQLPRVTTQPGQGVTADSHPFADTSLGLFPNILRASAAGRGSSPVAPHLPTRQKVIYLMPLRAALWFHHPQHKDLP